LALTTKQRLVQCNPSLLLLAKGGAGDAAALFATSRHP
jgi:hypothetical protein